MSAFVKQEGQKEGLASRRDALIGAAALAGSALFTGSAFGEAIDDRAEVNTPDEAIAALKAGNSRYVGNKSKAPRRDVAAIRAVAGGQAPFAAVLGCADSRVPVEILFDQGFGDIFVCRVAGNVATPEEIGSLEFGAAVLDTKVIVVLGHESCGAVKAAMDELPVPGSIGFLLDAVAPATKDLKASSPSGRLDEAIVKNVELQKSRLLRSAVISDAVGAGKLKVVGAVVNLDNGRVRFL